MIHISTEDKKGKSVLQVDLTEDEFDLLLLSVRLAQTDIKNSLFGHLDEKLTEIKLYSNK